MAISGLVLTLTDDPAGQAQAILSLAAMPELELGDLTGMRLPVVAETPHQGADRDLFERLQAMPGVLYADVAYVWFEPDADAAVDLAGEPASAPDSDPTYESVSSPASDLQGARA